MRLGNFESANLEPIGEGEERKVFVNPEDESRVISETKEGVEKDTPRQLKGRYYLTKIVHALLPNNIPDVHQVRESGDGKHTIDTERIFHTTEHTILQENRQSGINEESARKQIIEEMGEKMRELDLELERIGFGFNIDENVGNYTTDEAGNVHYLETFKPWKVNPIKPSEFEISFDEKDLREAIDTITDQGVKEKCTKHLERLMTLFEEDKQELQGSNEATLIECGPHIEELEALFAPFMTEEVLATLNAIQTGEDARNSEKRRSANEALGPILEKLNFLQDETTITGEKYDELYVKFRVLFNATGVINRGLVDHNR